MSDTEKLRAAIEFLESGKSTMIHKDIALTALREKLERDEQKPLTWDEVVAMEGEPAYIENLVMKSESMWAVIGEPFVANGLDFIQLYDELPTDNACRELYGETWLAYATEPKGERT